MTKTIQEKSIKIQIGAAIGVCISLVMFTYNYTNTNRDLQEKAEDGVKALVKYGELEARCVEVEKGIEIIQLKINYLHE